MKQQDHVHTILASLGKDHHTTRLLLISAGIGEPILGRGRYNGKDEVCFMLSRHLASDAVWQLLEDYGQESYLWLDNQRSAWLCRVGDDGANDPEYMGRFVGADKLTAERSEGFTEIGGNYYVVR